MRVLWDLLNERIPVAGVVKDDLFMRESVKATDVWMGPETEVGLDRELSMTASSYGRVSGQWTPCWLAERLLGSITLLAAGGDFRLPGDHRTF